jgi:hypothetical protein
LQSYSEKTHKCELVYTIIIPQEEPNYNMKQEILIEMERLEKEEPKQETLEEAAIKYATNHGMMAYVFPEKRESFIDGAKWQAERMYSEEDIKQAYLDGCRIKLTNPYHLDKWFEQFKKK